MAFRSEDEALRARRGVLEARVAEGRAKLAELRQLDRERARLDDRAEALFEPRPNEAAQWGGTRRGGLELTSYAKVGITLTLMALVPVVVLLVDADPLPPDYSPAAQPAVFGSVDLRLAEPPHHVEITVTSTDLAPMIPANCVGFIPWSPTLRLDASETMRIRIAATAEQALTLVLESPSDRKRCSDNTDGEDELFDGIIERGQHRLTIGSFIRGQTVEAALDIETHRAVIPPP